MNAFDRLRPSTIAASSSSTGTPATNPRSIHTVKGTIVAVYSTDTPITELSRPTDESILYCAMNRPSAGSIWMNSTARMNDRRPENRYRLTASAARKANASTARTVTSVTARLIRSAAGKLDPPITAVKLWIVGLVGRNDGVAERSRAAGVNAERTIQYTGNAQTAAAMMPTTPRAKRTARRRTPAAVGARRRVGRAAPATGTGALVTAVMPAP